MQNVKLNLIPGSVMPVVNVSQYDEAREFSLSVYEGASSYSLTGKTVEIRGTKPDGNGFAYDATDGVVSVSGSTVTISTTQQMTAVGGQTMAELRITSGSTVLGTLNFVLDVEHSALSDDTPISETEIPAIERDFQAALDEAEADALIAEGYAKGTQDGVPATSGEPYYQDNAKYYKEQAEAAASGGGADALKAEGYAVGTQNGTPVSSGSPYYQNNAKYYEGEAATSASNASTSETNAGLSETAAGNSASAAAADALKSEGFAIGEQNGTPVSSGSPYYENNAKYYKEQAALYAGGGLIFKGTVAFASIPTTGLTGGDMYNISDAFTTDSRFIEGSGISCAAGTNIAWIASDSKWDVLAPGGSGGSSTLSGLSDVTLTSLATGQVLQYDGSKWVNAAAPSSVPAGGTTDQVLAKNSNGDGDTKWMDITLAGAADVDINSPSGGQMLKYDADIQKWVNANAIFNYKDWLSAANISYSGFANLAAVLADEETVRHLMSIYDAVDYLTSFVATDTNIQTILNDDYAAKWLNLRDYAYDKLKSAFGAVMEIAGKYGYGEWAYINSTWQPKGNIPVLTSNNTPYGEASGTDSTGEATQPYKAFDGVISATDYFVLGPSNYLRYQFVNPVNVKRLVIIAGDTSVSPTYTRVCKLQGSNDGTTWSDVTDAFDAHPSSLDPITIETNTDNYYKYYQLVMTSYYGGAGYLRVISLQLYGRSLYEKQATQPTDGQPYVHIGADYYTVYYGQYDWDITTPRKYVYDHGLKLQPMAFTTEDVGNTLIDESSYIGFDDTLSNKACVVGTTTLIDTTPYTLMRGAVDRIIEGGNNVILEIWPTTSIVIGVTNVIAQTQITKAMMPHELKMDISTINQNVCVAIGSTRANVCKYTFNEIWLE